MLDLPEQVYIQPHIQNHVIVAPSQNWHLDTLRIATPVVQLELPKYSENPLHDSFDVKNKSIWNVILPLDTPIESPNYKGSSKAKTHKVCDELPCSPK